MEVMGEAVSLGALIQYIIDKIMLLTTYSLFHPYVNHAG